MLVTYNESLTNSLSIATNVFGLKDHELDTYDSLVLLCIVLRVDVFFCLSTKTRLIFVYTWIGFSTSMHCVH